MGDLKKLNTKQKNIFLTPEGLQELRAELALLKTEKRLELARRLQDARDIDTEENAEYDAAMVEQELVENRIAELERILRGAKLISANIKAEGIVTIGSTVVVQMHAGKLDEFTIVGKMEANPAKKRVSDESPIGVALIGSKIGERVEVLTPVTSYKVKIIEIK